MQLSQRLREETQELHTAAERSTAMRALMSGRMPVATYASLLRSLHVIYEALERGLSTHARRPALVLSADSRLQRAERLTHDLSAIAGRNWAIDIAVLPAAVTYAERLAWLADSNPDHLLAHAYVRYLGDLSGGQYLARAVRRAFSLEPDRAAAFYEFPEIAEPNAFKDEFRRSLDALPFTVAEANGIVAEARWAFAAHAQMFGELTSLKESPAATSA